MRRFSLSLLALFVLATSCSGVNHSIPPSDAARAALRIQFTSGRAVTVKAATLSYKLDKRNAKWLSVDFKGGEVQYLASSIKAISAFNGSNFRAISLSGIQYKASPYVRGAVTQCSGTPLSAGMRAPMCSGGSDCTIMDGSCVNTMGHCVYSNPCGATPGGSDWGVGSAVIGFHDGSLCEIDFSIDSIDCYDNATPPSNPDADLFLSFRSNVVGWTATCANPQSDGWATAHYRDRASSGSAFQWIHAAPGSNQWVYPEMFPAINQQMPYAPPIDFSSAYYRAGGFAHLFPEREGHCNYAGN